MNVHRGGVAFHTRHPCAPGPDFGSGSFDAVSCPSSLRARAGYLLACAFARCTLWFCGAAAGCLILMDQVCPSGPETGLGVLVSPGSAWYAEA